MEHKSEVARIRERIDLECQAMKRMFEEPAIVASHVAIDARYRNLNGLAEELRPLVGDAEATKTLVDIYNDVIK